MTFSCKAIPFLSVILVSVSALPGHSQQAAPPATAQPNAQLPTPLLAPDAPPQDPFGSENLDEVSVASSQMHATKPIPGQTDTTPEFTRELLRVQWRTGDPIDLYIVRPVGIAKPPVIVYLYGYPGEAVRFLNNSFCKTLTRNGFAAVGFSGMLTGQRYHDVPMKEWFVSELSSSLVGTAHDVQMVLDYLTTRDDMDMARVGVFGEGSGASVALLSASVDPRIRAVDLLNPWGDWPSWLSKSSIIPEGERSEYLEPEFLTPLKKLDPVTLLPQLTHTPIRLQQNLWEIEKVPVASQQRIAAAIPPSAKLSQYHDLREYVELVGTNGRMLDWLQEQLSPQRSPSNHPVR